MTYPGLVSVEKFKQDLLSFLSKRSSGQFEGDESPNAMYGTSISWMALLFAVFASGAQFSPVMQKTQRDLISGVYGEWGLVSSFQYWRLTEVACCSFECLRLVNYLANASLDGVQALLVLGNVLCIGMNAGASWSFLGELFVVLVSPVL